MFVKADYFAQTVLKIEGDNVPAVDVVFHLDVLKGNILVRRDEHYLDPATEDEKNNLIEMGFAEQVMDDIITQFYGE